MRLYTIQKQVVLDTIMKDEVAYPNDMIMYDGARYAYDWMAEKMTLIIGEENRKSKYPFWAFDSKNNFVISDNGLNDVLLVLEVPEKDVLLSEFQRWHLVLNESSKIYYDNDNRYDSSKRIKRRYDRIFKKGRDDCWQACFWYINKEMIIEATTVKDIPNLVRDEETEAWYIKAL